MKTPPKKLEIDGRKLKIAIILPRFNEEIGLKMLDAAKNELLQNNVREKNITIIRVNGALEIPFACKKIITSKKPDAIIALGVVIRGETTHYDLVTQTTYQGIMQVQLETQTPIAFGVLACENEKQALTRISKGAEAAQTALTQALL